MLLMRGHSIKLYVTFLRRFPFEELHKLKRPVQENKDSSDTEDDDDNEDDDDGNDQDDDANDEDFSG